MPFVFQKYRSPRYLHSFPTRRSSDLQNLLLRSLPCGQQASYRTEQKGKDRNSTRLNSSHLGISYAVFCLKQKKVQYKVDTSDFHDVKAQLNRLENRSNGIDNPTRQTL